MSGKRDYVAEIKEIRERDNFQYGRMIVSVRIHELARLFEERKAMPREMLNYFPVALVALMEGFFRSAVQQLVDSDVEYLLRLTADGAPAVKFDWNLVAAIQSKQVTLGELASHLLPVNDLGSLNAHLSKLFGRNFLKGLETVHDRWKVEIQKKPKVPILQSPGEVFRDVEETFQIRHRICHELTGAKSLTIEDAERYFANCGAFLRASDAYISAVQFPNSPLTQTDMNIATYETWKVADAELARVVGQVLQKLSPDRRAKFEKFQGHWKDFRDATVEYAAEGFREGSIAPTIRNNAATEITEERTERLRRYLATLDKDGPDIY